MSDELASLLRTRFGLDVADDRSGRWRRLEASRREAILKDREGTELQRLASELVAGETHFMRHPAQFEEVRKLIQNRHSRRIWSAGCACGAEAYSLLMVAESLGKRVEIVATDLNREAIARARQGIFSEWEMRGCDASMRERFFIRAGNCWQVREELLNRIAFREHNLVEDPILGTFDLILCRNVLLYLEPQTCRLVVHRLAQALRPRGIVMFGFADPVAPDASLVLETAALAKYIRGQPVVHEPITPMVHPGPVQHTPVSEPDQALAEYQRAVRWVEEDRLELALEGFRRALYLDPDLAAAHFRMGQLRLFLDERAQAKRSFRNVLNVCAKRHPEAAVPGWESISYLELCGWADRQLEHLP